MTGTRQGAITPLSGSTGTVPADCITVLRSRLAGLDTGAGSVTAQILGSATVGYDGVHLRVEEGVVREVGLGRLPEPDLTLIVGGDALGFLCGLTSPRDLADGVVRIEGPRGEQWVVPPFDLAILEGLAIATIPDASLVIGIDVSDAPVGDYSCWLCYESGRFRSIGLSPGPEPAVALAMTFDGLLRHRVGDAALAEALRDQGAIRGDWPELMLAAGLLDRPEHVEALRITGAPRPTLRALATLSEVLTSPNVASVLASIRDGAQ